MSDSSQFEVVEKLADEFAQRCRSGERPSIQEYIDRHPEHAELIRDTFRALELVEQFAPEGMETEDAQFLNSIHHDEGDLPGHLGDYRIIREIGRGGMGIVYEAEQISLGRQVAVKVLPQQLTASDKQKSRFQREAKAAARLHHSNIVPVFGVGEESGRSYYAMQFICGLSMDKVLREVKRIRDSRENSAVIRKKKESIGEDQAKPGVSQELTATSLAASLLGETQPAHTSPGASIGHSCEIGCDDRKAGFEHPQLIVASDHANDSADRAATDDQLSNATFPSDSLVTLPTENMQMLDSYWDSVASIGLQVANALHYAHLQGVLHRDVKPANLLLDLQGTVWVADFGLAKLDGDRDLTQSGDVLGTLRYMAPESLQGRTDARSEVYSLGLTLYEFLALRPAFDKPGRSELVNQVATSNIAHLSFVNPEIPNDLQTIVHKTIENDPNDRYQTAQELADDLNRFLNRYSIRAKKPGVIDRTRKFIRRNKVLSATVAFAVCSLIAASILLLAYESAKRKERIAREVKPRIRKLIAEGEFTRAFELAESVENILVGDEEFDGFWWKMSARITITSNPSGASVSMRAPGESIEDARQLGTTPLQNTRVPRGCYSWRITKNGYETSDLICVSENNTTIQCDLVSRGYAPDDMVRIPGGKPPLAEVFFIDRDEVSNADYQHFVSRGGYEDLSFWTELFDDKGVESGAKILEGLVDRTGKPGPAGWSLGAFPSGEDEMPVRGICWYEAVAYAAFAGKSLPTIHHWRQATGRFKHAFATLHNSNIGGRFAGPRELRLGMGHYGTYNMAGNVREWCWNSWNADRRYQLGGCWDDPTYLYSDPETADALNRADNTGFRCIWHEPNQTPDPTVFKAAARDSFVTPAEPAVSDEVFESWRQVWSYSNDAVKPVVVTENANEHWVEEVIEFEQPRSSEKMRAHLFVPHGLEPPFPTILFFPGGSSNKYEPEFGVKKSSNNWVRLNFLVRSGRAVCCPIYSGTYDRSNEMVRRGTDPHGHLDWSNRVLREVRRTIDVLETMPKIDAERIAYVGTSWGGSMGPRILAVEPRLKAGILAIGGLYHGDGLPQTNDVNFLPRVKAPVLMLNGRHDLWNPKSEVEYVFDNLGTEPTDKHLKFFETGHAVPVEQLLEWTDHWLDRYLDSN